MIASLLFPFVVLVFLTRTVYAGVLITEVMYDPPGTDMGHEWVEIMNDGDVSVDAQSLRFVEADARHRMKESSGGTSIAPGATAVIVQDSALFRNEYQSYQGHIFLSSFSLRQQEGIGEPLGIYNIALDQMEHAISYTPDDRADGTGASLHLTLGGTQVSAPATPGSIAINPIADQSALVEAESLQEVLEEVVSQDVPLVIEEKQPLSVEGVSDTPNTVVPTQDEDVLGLAPQRQVVMVPGGGAGGGTLVLWLVVALLGVIVLELRVIARRLRRLRSVQRG